MEMSKGTADVRLYSTHLANGRADMAGGENPGALEVILERIAMLHEVQTDAASTLDLVHHRMFGPSPTTAGQAGPQRGDQPPYSGTLLEIQSALDAALSKACEIRDAAYGVQCRI